MLKSSILEKLQKKYSNLSSNDIENLFEIFIKKIKNSLKELGLHCEDMHVLGVYKADKIRKK